MAYRFSRSILGIVATVSLTAVATVILTMLWVREQPTAGQTDAYRAPRTADGAPDLNGVWQALNTANWDLQDHAARPSPVVATGARGAIPAGQGVVDGGEIPYQPWAAAHEEREPRQLADPAIPRSSASCRACHAPPICRFRFRSSKGRVTS